MKQMGGVIQALYDKVRYIFRSLLTYQATSLS